MAIIEISTGFGEKLRTPRNSSGMTQESLASLMNVTRQTVSGWETGRILRKLSVT